MPYKRKTQDVWAIQTYTGSQYGWETVTTELKYRDAVKRVREYRENEPQYSHRIKLTRVKVTEQ